MPPIADFYHIKVSGDGNCLFHSFSGNLHLLHKMKNHNQQSYTTHKGNKLDIHKASTIRTKLATWMKNNLDFQVQGSQETIRTAIQDAVNDNPKKYKTITTYLKKMKTSGQYGGQPEIYAFSHLYKMNVITYIKDNQTYKSYGGALSCIRDTNKENTIYLFHNVKQASSSSGHHFEILFPRNKATIIPLKEYNSIDKQSKSPTKKTKSKTKPQRTTRRSQRMNRRVNRRSHRQVNHRSHQKSHRRSHRKSHRRSHRKSHQKSHRKSHQKSHRKVNRQMNRVNRRSQKKIN